MNGTYKAFLTLPQRDRRDVFEAAARRLDTLPGYVEKDFWVCLTLERLYHGLPRGHPKLLFKGGTSLSKAFGLISRFSEDIDLVAHREALGFGGERDPTFANGISNRRRKALFKELKAACSTYILGDLRSTLAIVFDDIVPGCRVVPDEDDPDGQTLLIEYPSLFPMAGVSYVSPRVKIEAGARSALGPRLTCAVSPYVAHELSGWKFEVGGISVLAPERTYWEKVLILHGLFFGYRDFQRIQTDKDRISRHYYDVAMISATETGKSALADVGLLEAVRDHNLVAFRQAWKRFEEAVPGSVRLVPQSALIAVIRRDYRAMRGMILGDVPEFDWVMEQLRLAEATINGT